MEMKIHLLVLSLTSLTLFHPTSAICVKRNASMQQFGPSIARPVAPPATQSVSLSTPQSSQPLQSDPAKSLEAQKNQQPQTQPSTPDQTPQTQQSAPSQAQPVQPPLAQQTTPSPAQPVQTPPTQQATPAPTQSAQQPPTQSVSLSTPQSSQPLQSDPAKSLEAQKNQQPQTQPSTPAPVKSDQPPLPQQGQPHDGLGQPAPLDSPDGPVPSTPTNPPAQPSLSTPLDSPDGPVQPTPVDSPDGPVPANPVDSPDGTAPLDSPDGPAPLDSPDGPAPVEGVALSNFPFLNIPGITIADPQPAEPSHGKESKGIQELCHKTDFPDVCMSLIPPNTNPDPASALRALINVGKEKAKAAMDASKNMSVNSPPADMVTSTLEVCHESYGDTISDFDSALKALDAHDHGTLMTMLSGALTSTGTCSDSFAELPGVVSPVATPDDPITTLTRICLAFGDMMK